MISTPITSIYPRNLISCFLFIRHECINNERIKKGATATNGYTKMISKNS
jgi:hypothetical protein